MASDRRTPLERTEEFMRREGLLPPQGAMLLCAVSGGVDSVTLLHVLRELSHTGAFALAAAHYDHRLRGEESAADAEFVRQLCERWGIPCVIGAGDVACYAREHGLGIEEAARICRYGFLEETAQRLGAARIATAHHAEDNAETVLMQLLRGSGSEGGGGIAPTRGRVIRPFLPLSREEIERYAAQNGIEYREDASNRDLRFTRNRIRCEVLPLLRQLNPAAVEAITRAAAVRREEGELLQRLARDALGEVTAEREGASARREHLCRAEPALRARMLGVLLDAAGIGRRDITARHFEAMSALVLCGADGAEVHLPGARCCCRGEKVVILRARAALPCVPLLPGQRVQWGGYTLDLSEDGAEDGAMALRRETLPLFVGAWRRDQGLTLPQSRGRRSLKRLFSERGIAACERDAMAVVYTAQGRAVAAAEIGMDTAFAAATEDAKLWLTIKKTERV